jgi:uncharacterized protein (TIGR02145 family)
MRNASGILALIIAVVLINSCKEDKTDPPSVKTLDVTEITFTTATSGGHVISDGGDSVIIRGICWSTTASPTVENSKTTESGSLGAFVSTLSGLEPDTRYFVRAYATNSTGTGYGNQVAFSTSLASLPELTTSKVISIAQKSAISGGLITSENGSSVVLRGICWSLSPNPTVSDSKSTSGNGLGAFSRTITGLEVNTTYYVRAFATNRIGTSYGNELVFSTVDYGALADISGNLYKTVTIGTQEWLTENLKATSYSNGDPVPYIPGENDWNQLSGGAYCWYNNTEIPSRDTYGALYNWYTISDTRNICPQGWHVPNDADWTKLTDFLRDNGYGYGGSGEDIAKSMAATSGWTVNSTVGTIGNDQTTNNSSGFAALPGGVRVKNGIYATSEYTCSFWSSSEHSYGYGNALTLTGEFINIFRGYTFKQDGASVRCLKD